MMDYGTAKAELEELERMQTDLPELIKQAAQAGDYKTAKELRLKQSTLADDIMGAKETMLIALIDQNAAKLSLLKPQLHQAKADQASLLAQRAKLEKQIKESRTTQASLSHTFGRLHRSCLKATAELNQLHKERMMQASGEQPPKTVDFLSPEAWGLGKAAGHIKLRPPLFAGAIPGYIPLGQAEQIATAAIKERRKLGPLGRPARTS